MHVIRTSVTNLAIASCALFFLPHVDVICNLLLNNCTTTWNLFDKYKRALAKTSPLFKSDLETTLSRSVEQQNYFLIYFYLLFLHHVWFHCDRKRDTAKLCTNIAWRNNCNRSDVADGILKKVIGSFNPFCDGDKDPLAEQPDQCANYPTPPDAEVCPPSPSEQPETKSSAGVRHGVVPYLLYVVLFITPSFYLNNRITI